MNRMQLFRLTLYLLVLPAAAMQPGCSSGGAVDAPPEGAVFEGLPPYLAERPELTDWSLWQSVFDHDDPIPQRCIGGFGVGNGHVFSMVASVVPFTTLHNLTGPHYQKHLRFFSDKIFTLRLKDRPVAWDYERAYRVRGTAVCVVRLDGEELSLWTIDFAPRQEGVIHGPASNTLVRIMVIHNRGPESVSGLSLEVETLIGRAADGMILETVWDDARKLAAGFTTPGLPVSEEGKRLILDIDEIPPRGELVTPFALAFATCGGNPRPALDTVALLGPERLLDETLAAWKRFTGDGARIITSDRRFDDLVEGLSVTIATQQAATGGVSEMSEYSHTWLRDIMGPARFYTLIGRIPDYRRMLDYYWLAALDRGNIANALELDIQPAAPPPQPDWESLPTLSGRESAEGPSYLILHYKAYLDATGDWGPLIERYGMLRHALIHQDFRHDCLLPFSDDETFRTAMAATFGHSLFNEYQTTHLSANSSFLWVVAAQFMEEVARHLGFVWHADEYRAMVRDVRDCTEQHYWLESDGFYAPMIDIHTLAPVDRPYEDINTKPLWAGYLAPDDPKAQANILNSLEALDSEGGLYYSPLHPIYRPVARLLGFEKGIVTGMTYGYQLDNLARIDHPLAEEAFLMYRRFFHDCGNVSEDQVVDDFGRAAYFFEPFGFLCDLTARYRSWEGGINGAAMLRYLFGLELDALKGRIRLAPHLPAGWDLARMEKARLGAHRFDITVEDDGRTRRVRVDRLTGPLLIDAMVSVEGGIEAVFVNGDSVQPFIESQWGRARVRLPGLFADDLSPLTIEVIKGGN